MNPIDQSRLPLVAGGLQLSPPLPVDRPIWWPVRPLPPIRPVPLTD